MPQYTDPPEKVTPFAQMLIDYMWNRRPRNRPPLTYTQVAVRLGIPKQSVSNWILRGSVPPLDTIFIIMAKLGIPLSTLYTAYLTSGLTAPAWDNAALANATPTDELPATPRHRKPASVPLPENESLTPRAYIPPTITTPDERATADYDRMIAQTTATMRDDGFPQSVIDAAIAAIRAQQHSQQTGAPSPRDQHVAAEHTEPAVEPATSDQANHQPNNVTSR